MTTDPVDQLAAAVDAVAREIGDVRPGEWTAPTPCSEWNVTDLVAHLVNGHERFAAILRGESPPPLATPGGVAPSADLLPEYRDTAAAMLEAFRRPGALDAMCEVPIGSVPGIVALHLRITEALVHGWDLARATGQTTAFDDSVVRQELEFTRGKLDDVPPGRRRFAPPHPVADDAPPLDQLVACLGRDPNWSPPT